MASYGPVSIDTPLNPLDSVLSWIELDMRTPRSADGCASEECMVKDKQRKIIND